MRLTSILVASDLSGGSDDVVRAAGEIAAAAGAALHVIHAFDLPGSGGDDLPEGVRATFPGRVASTERDLRAQVERVIPEGVHVASVRVEIFVAHLAILDAAEAADAELIVVGPHGRRVGDTLLGGTADRVIRGATVPCLVVRAPLRIPLRTMIVPVDRSGAASAALQVALQWAVALDDGGRPPPRITALHVFPRTLHLPEFEARADEIRDAIAEDVAEVVREGGFEGLVEVETSVRWGTSATDEVVERARAGAADLVVLGTHGRGVIRRFLLGSVASGVAQRAPCPVLLVPPAMWEEGAGEGEVG